MLLVNPAGIPFFRLTIFDALDPVVRELQTCLGTFVQKVATNEKRMQALTDDVVAVADRLVLLYEWQDAIVQCYKHLSAFTDDERVMALLAASWQLKLDSKEAKQIVRGTSSYKSHWSRYRRRLTKVHEDVRSKLTPGSR